MNREALKTAIAEAKRFIDRAERAERGFHWREHTVGGGGWWDHDDTAATAAAKRASMDLTRALADLRRSG